MRLPWGSLSEIWSLFLVNSEICFIGCLSFEERCRVAPLLVHALGGRNAVFEFIQIRDPDDAFPNYSDIIESKIATNIETLSAKCITHDPFVADLLASEDDLLDLVDQTTDAKRRKTVVLDITSFPKRFFCFFLKRFLLEDAFRNVVVTYTEPGPDGHTQGHLAYDPLPCDHLPGFAGPLPPEADHLVISVGFETLNINSLLEVYRDRKQTKLICAFPPDRGAVRRQWNTLRQITSGRTETNIRSHMEVMALWDAELVYLTLDRWSRSANGLALAPFGPKQHSLGMTLFAIETDCGLYYTQPKSYDPEYSKGSGNSWAYVVKWDGLPCYRR